MTISLRLACFLVVVPAGFVRAQVADFPLHFVNESVVGTTAFLERPIGASVGADGSIVVSDLGSRKILKFDANGALVWRVGRSGHGPGEYVAPARVLILADSSVLVYDVGNPLMTRLNPDGSYRSMVELDESFSIIDNLVALPDGGIAVSGIAKPGGRADTTAGVHVFDAGFRLRRSFGPLPPIRNRAFLSQWGAGGLSSGANGELIYSPRHPYQIIAYSLTGQQLGIVRSALPLTGTPDDAFSVAVSGEKVTTTSAAQGVTRTRKAYRLADGRFLSGRMTGVNSTLEVFSAAGSLIASRAGMPDHWIQIAGYDFRRNVLWVFGEIADAPVLLRYDIR